MTPDEKLNVIVRTLYKMSADRVHLSSAARRAVYLLAQRLEDLGLDYADALDEARSIGARLPEFDGDEMGRPADD